MSARRQEPSSVVRIGRSCLRRPTLIRIDRKSCYFHVSARIFQPWTTNLGFPDSTHRRLNVSIAETRITCSNGLRLQGGVQFPTGGIARERLRLQGQQIWWNSRADGIVRMKEDVSIIVIGVCRRRLSCAHFAAQRRLRHFAKKGALMTSSILDSSSSQIETSELPADRIERALDDMRRGHPVILLDDWDRENEADLIVAADRISVSVMALLIRECSGIVCLCLNEVIADRLRLHPMVEKNESRFQTAFTVSIEARDGVTTGVSAQDRVTTIRAAVAVHAQPTDLVHPGHVFPLRAARNGVLTRRGHTEGAVDLAILAGLQPAALLCELTNPDGSMSKGAEIISFAQNHQMTIVSVTDLVTYRLPRSNQR
jgi:3,4-dihydroxy 2-butanone 4-phosphate synthase